MIHSIGKIGLLILILPLMACTNSVAEPSKHPTLVLTANDVALIRQKKGAVPSFDKAIARLEKQLAASMETPMDVPVPVDAGGGYTHEQHKRNYQAIYGAGVLYQITGEDKYLEHAKALFYKYAELYPTLREHPKKKEQAPGRLFWQSLNETVFLVHAIQGYDAIIDGLTDSDRHLIETRVLRPMAKFLSIESASTFNKVHNHGTWAVAGVGMTGYVLGDQELVEQALYGLDKSGKAGFIKQLDKLFSPDGYYTEGPYYQRYALMPFVLFAKAIDNNEPERKIFEYRDKILLKAITTTIQLSYNDLFFPINDALKDKGLDTIELVHGVSIAYGLTKDPELLSIAKAQHTLSITGDGLAVAEGIDGGKTKPFSYRSMQLSDGSLGDQGALAIFRAGEGDDHQALVVKNTSMGMGHGHFDKLNWLFYDNGNEIVTDYGAARFLNVESKYGGHYLPENKAWARQTIAHNTLTVDQKSQFAADWKAGQKIAPQVRLFETSDDVNVTSASVVGAYPDVVLSRTMATIQHKLLEFPLVVDILKARAESTHQYDLPVHFNGHITNLSFAVKPNAAEQVPLGSDNGYQFLWDKARGRADDDLPQVTWIKDNRFYTASFAKADKQEFIFTQLGANDPNFNLRPEQAVIQRVSGAQNHAFLSVLEKHGDYNPSLEYTKSSVSQIKHIELLELDGFDVVTIELVSSNKLVLAIAYNGDKSSKHSLPLNGKTIQWTGHHTLFEISDEN